MKKNYTLALLFSAFAVAGFSQSTRLVLSEEYSRASCVACAAQDSAYHVLMAANPTKVVSLNYHVAGIGADPMNANTAAQVSTRVLYYNIPNVSNCRIDGDSMLVYDPSHVLYTGNPDNLTQTDINTEYAVNSRFTVTVSHTMSPDYDSAFVTVLVHCSQNFTAAGFLKLRLAMVEKNIHFDTDPGGNGQTDFYNVMDGMYPNTTGTAMNASWNNNQNQTYNISMAIPSYVYDKNQVDFVAWIQDDGNYQVKQAGQDNPVQLVKDAAVTSIGGLPTSPCTPTFLPTVTFKNMGSATLTSCVINYQIDANSPQTYTWNGSITSGNTAVATLPSQTVSASGTHTFTAWPTLPNNTTDYNTNSDTKTSTFLIIGPAVAAPLIEDFTPATFPPTGWSIINADNDARTWLRSSTTGGFQASTSCSWMNFYNSPVGYKDEMMAQNVDMTATTNKTLTFDVAYCQSAAETDTLKVMVSTDCGMTWTTVYNKSGNTLKTKAPQSSSFVPTLSTQWRLETVDLTPYGTSTGLVIKFVAISDYGNNVFVDDINIGTTGILENITDNDVSVYPNPFDNFATLDINLSQAENVSVSLYDVTGNLISVENEGELSTGKHSIQLNGKNLADGIYLVKITSGDAVVTKRISISH
jgi:hypothetical protein